MSDLHFTHEHTEDLLIHVYRTVIVADDAPPVTVVWAKRDHLGIDETDNMVVEVHPDPEALFNLFGSSDGNEIFEQIIENWANS